jgi:hypothetical protein
MRLLRGRARPWFAAGLVLAILGFFILDGIAAGVALAVAMAAVFVGVMRVLSRSDLSGVTHGGGEGGGFG